MNEDLKVFWLYAWDSMYPSGCLRDLKGTYYGYDDAAQDAEQFKGKYDYVEIVDVSEFLGISCY